MNNYLADKSETFFLDKSKPHLSTDELEILTRGYKNIPDLDRPAVSASRVDLMEVLEQFFKATGSTETANNLYAKVAKILTQDLELEVRDWPATKKNLKRYASNVSQYRPLDLYNEQVGLIVRHSQKILSTFIQEWYWRVLVPKLQERSVIFWVVTIVTILFLFGFFASQFD